MRHSRGQPADIDLQALRGAISALPRHARVAAVEVDGQRFWVKRPEHHDSLRLRLQKGSAARAFARERQALADLAARGLPVPVVVDEGADYFVTRDAGTPLSALLRNPLTSKEERLHAFDAAAVALHALHEAGVAHGRPNLRDLLWDGERVTLIDFERYTRRRNDRLHQAMDVIMFVFSAYVAAQADQPEIESAISAYRAVDVAGIWPIAARLLSGLRWIGPLTEPIRRRKPRSREVGAVLLTLRRFLR